MRYSGLRSTEEECVLYRRMERHLTWSTLADLAGLVLVDLGCDAWMYGVFYAVLWVIGMVEEEDIQYKRMECHLTWSTLADPAGLGANLGCDAGCMVCLMLYVGLQSLVVNNGISHSNTHTHIPSLTHIHESVSNHCNGGSNLTKRGQVSN